MSFLNSRCICLNDYLIQSLELDRIFYIWHYYRILSFYFMIIVVLFCFFHISCTREQDSSIACEPLFRPCYPTQLGEHWSNDSFERNGRNLYDWTWNGMHNLQEDHKPSWEITSRNVSTVLIQETKFMFQNVWSVQLKT